VLKERESVPSELQHEGRAKEMEIVMNCEGDKKVRIKFGITVLCNCYYTAVATDTVTIQQWLQTVTIQQWLQTLLLYSSGCRHYYYTAVAADSYYTAVAADTVTIQQWLQTLLLYSSGCRHCYYTAVATDTVTIQQWLQTRHFNRAL
jgi:aryl carrier-like protein